MTARIPNVWLQPLTDKRKHCRMCEAPITTQNQHLSVGEYIRGKFRNAFYCCGMCLMRTCTARVGASSFNLCTRSGYRMPWYRAEESTQNHP